MRARWCRAIPLAFITDDAASPQRTAHSLFSPMGSTVGLDEKIHHRLIARADHAVKPPRRTITVYWLVW